MYRYGYFDETKIFLYAHFDISHQLITLLREDGCFKPCRSPHCVRSQVGQYIWSKENLLSDHCYGHSGVDSQTINLINLIITDVVDSFSNNNVNPLTVVSRLIGLANSVDGTI